MNDRIPLAVYSAALDEIYRLRQALAYEAAVSTIHGDYKSFPKSRRPILMDQVRRMELAAQGESEAAYAGVGYSALRYALREAGASEILTRAEFEASLREGGES